MPTSAALNQVECMNSPAKMNCTVTPMITKRQDIAFLFSLSVQASATRISIPKIACMWASILNGKKNDDVGVDQAPISNARF